MSVEPKVAATSALWPCLRLRSVLGTGRQVPHVQSCNYRKNPRVYVDFWGELDRLLCRVMRETPTCTGSRNRAEPSSQESKVVARII